MNEYSAFDLARYVLKKCIDEDHYISNVQLQKILYCIQESFLREKHRKAFSEPIEAWQYGPVVPKVYDKYCIYGGRTIVWIPNDPDIVLKDEKDKALIDKIVEEKREVDPWETVQKTFKEGGAWAKVYDNGKGAYKEIPVKIMKDYLGKREGQFMENIKAFIKFLEELCRTKNFGYFVSAIAILGMGLRLNHTPLLLWFPVSLCGACGLLVYNWRRGDLPQVLLFMATIIALLFI
jgi:uncharacterized phage-associated protein